MNEPEQTILFVLTSTSAMDDGGHRTGARLEEFTVPYYPMRDAGFFADVVTTAGGAVPIRAVPARGEWNRRGQTLPV
jgi:hypothetical protein